MTTPSQATDVVWWSPSALQLDAEPPFGLRREDLIAKDAGDVRRERGTNRLRRLGRSIAPPRSRMAPPRRSTSGPSPSSRTPASGRPASPSSRRWRSSSSRAKASVREAAASARSCTPCWRPRRSTPTRPCSARSRRWRAASWARPNTRSPPPRRSPPACSRTRCWRAARAAEAAGQCRREVPVTLTLSDGRLLEGVVDLAYEHEGAWTVVDFKTDEDPCASSTRTPARWACMRRRSRAPRCRAPTRGRPGCLNDAASSGLARCARDSRLSAL